MSSNSRYFAENNYQSITDIINIATFEPVNFLQIHSRYTHPSNSIFLVAVYTFGVIDFLSFTITMLENYGISVS